jgi:hypothetical protein
VGVTGAILSSNDGVNWQPRTLGGTVSYKVLRAVAYGNGIFVVTGSRGLILTSPDGLSWTLRASGAPESVGGVQYSLGEVAFGNGVFVAIGPRAGGPAPSGGGALVSSDGIKWTQTSTNILRALAFDGREFIVNGPGIFTSVNGSNWVQRSTNLVDARFIAHGNGMYVGAGLGLGYLSTSTDGVDWTKTPNDLASLTWTRLLFHDGQFMGLGPSLFKSRDGLNWTVLDSVPVFGSGIAFGAGRQVMTQGSNYTDSPSGPGWIYSSFDGTNWVQDLELPDNALTAVAYGNGRFVAVGSEALLVSERLESAGAVLRLMGSATSPRINVTGSPGEVHELEASFDLRSWTSLGLVTLTNTVGELIDPAPISPYRFYRSSQKAAPF